MHGCHVLAMSACGTRATSTRAASGDASCERHIGRTEERVLFVSPGHIAPAAIESAGRR